MAHTRCFNNGLPNLTPKDVIANKNNPRIIAKYEKHGDTYSIPEFNL